jgi:thioredoxin 1
VLAMRWVSSSIANFCGLTVLGLLLLTVGCEWMAPAWESAPSRIPHVGVADFEERVLRSDVPVLVDFFATWCGPCQMLAPVLEELARDRDDVRIVKIDVDRDPELASRYGVTSIPTLLVFKNGRVHARHSGVLNQAEVLAMLQK